MGLLSKRKRKQYLIDSSFQFQYMFTWLIIMLLFIVVVIGGLILGLKMIYKSETYGLSEIAFMLKLDAVFIVFITIAIGIYLLLLSHRIAGPAYRLEKSIQQIIEGDYDFSVNLRQKDYLKNVADALNNLLKVLNGNKKNLNMTLEDIRKLKSMVSNSNISSEVKDSVNRIEKRILEISSKDKPAIS